MAVQYLLQQGGAGTREAKQEDRIIGEIVVGKGCQVSG